MGRKKKGRRSQPVQPKKKFEMSFTVPKVKTRGVFAPAVRYHKNRARDVHRGSRRHPKHKGRRDY